MTDDDVRCCENCCESCCANEELAGAVEVGAAEHGGCLDWLLQHSNCSSRCCHSFVHELVDLDFVDQILVVLELVFVALLQ